MAFTTNQSQAQMVTEMQTVNVNLTTDACNTILTSLAAGYQQPIGTPILVGTLLIKATTGYGTPSSQTTPVFAYDAAPA